MKVNADIKGMHAKRSRSAARRTYATHTHTHTHIAHGQLTPYLRSGEPRRLLPRARTASPGELCTWLQGNVIDRASLRRGDHAVPGPAAKSLSFSSVGMLSRCCSRWPDDSGEGERVSGRLSTCMAFRESVPILGCRCDASLEGASWEMLWESEDMRHGSHGVDSDMALLWDMAEESAGRGVVGVG